MKKGMDGAGPHENSRLAVRSKGSRDMRSKGSRDMRSKGSRDMRSKGSRDMRSKGSRDMRSRYFWDRIRSPAIHSEYSAENTGCEGG